MAGRRIRVLLASRIFEPEPGAAPLRLAALTHSLLRRDAEIVVLTSAPPRGIAIQDPADDRLSIRRAPVLRDEHGYLRGYIQYMSFDVPLFFRLLFARRPDVVVCEPPPTTGIVVRTASRLRRLPYVYYAADLWSDAATATEAPSAVVSAVQRMERAVVRGAAVVLSVGQTYTERLGRWRTDGVETVGHGVDTQLFSPEGPVRRVDGPYFLYAGTASEVHGATVFVDAFRLLLQTRPNARLVFLGHGQEFPSLRLLSETLPPGVLLVMPQAPAEEAAEWIRGALATLASVRPGTDYQYFVPTKSYASLACGTPVIHAGPGPLGPILTEEGLGHSVAYDPADVAAAMAQALDEYPSNAVSQRAVSWARRQVSAQRVGDAAATAVLSAARPQTTKGAQRFTRRRR